MNEFLWMKQLKNKLIDENEAHFLKKNLLLCLTKKFKFEISRQIIKIKTNIKNSNQFFNCKNWIKLFLIYIKVILIYNMIAFSLKNSVITIN